MLENLIEDAPFFIISFFCVLFALGVILSKSIVRAGLCLLVCFGSISGIYFLLQAPFVAASQILIYAVGITLVIIFGVMLTNVKDEPDLLVGEDKRNMIAGVVSFALFALLGLSLTVGSWGLSEAPLVCPKNTEIIGLKLLSTYILPFELISVLLLVSLIGAIVIAKKDKPCEKGELTND